MKPKSIRATCTESAGKFIMAYNELRELNNDFLKMKMDYWQKKIHEDIINPKKYI